MGTISVNNLGKAYKQYPTRWSRLLEWITLGNAKRHQLKRVLQDINFSVNAGEAVGIIGINGAGKSTLLKLITGTTMPTTGSVHMTGRVAAMLELGMGFHPDFTGRQNAFMAGQLLGISSQDIARLMPEIEAFAEIGDFFDQPLRVYSSGMQARLAFAVAAHLRGLGHHVKSGDGRAAARIGGDRIRRPAKPMLGAMRLHHAQPALLDELIQPARA